MLFISFLPTLGEKCSPDLEGEIHIIHPYILSSVQTYSTQKGKIDGFFASTVLNMHKRILEFL